MTHVTLNLAGDLPKSLEALDARPPVLPEVDQALLQQKLAYMRQILRDMDSVLVAFSGGADSTLVLKVALDVLGDRAAAGIGVSETYPRREMAEALALAVELGAQVELVSTKELSDPHYSMNPTNRCYYCKSELFAKLRAVAESRDLAWVADGSNMDDATSDYRPGLQAASELGVRSPLREAGLTKAEIRQASRRLSLRTWNKPSFACLASRFPYQSPITRESLCQVDDAEQYLYDLGFRQVRVRHHGEIARIEVEPEEMSRLVEPDVRDRMVARMKELGYRYIVVDLAGYRTGSMNEGLV
ncbi:MAG: ATP-dependent sacrificial sulfur transferase LarE [Actinobacteria bacterium]|nr:ATP-dependent sacrificial sulfur transferase LarE [Actinomycetota bacterium]